jgi:hypothetical protein
MVQAVKHYLQMDFCHTKDVYCFMRRTVFAKPRTNRFKRNKIVKHDEKMKNIRFRPIGVGDSCFLLQLN